MLNKSILGFLVIFGVSSAAVAQEDSVRGIYRQSEQVYDLIKKKAHRLDGRSQRELSRKLTDIASMLNGLNSQRPNHPRPRDPFEVLVRGQIQGRPSLSKVPTFLTFTINALLSMRPPLEEVSILSFTGSTSAKLVQLRTVPLFGRSQVTCVCS